MRSYPRPQQRLQSPMTGTPCSSVSLRITARAPVAVQARRRNDTFARTGFAAHPDLLTHFATADAGQHRLHCHDFSSDIHHVVVERDEKYMAEFDEQVPGFIEKMDTALAEIGFQFGDQWR